MTKTTTTTAVRKPRTTVATKATKTTKTVAQPKTFFALVAGARPAAGVRLYAHTHAALKFFGLLDGKAALRAAVESVMGKSAVDYHIAHENMAAKDSKVKLTPNGRASFEARAETGKVDMSLAEAFYAAIANGEGNRAHQISVAHLVAVKNLPV
jgi:hypothetical protein